MHLQPAPAFQPRLSDIAWHCATPTVHVALRGKHGAGQYAALDDAEWQYIGATWGTSWQLVSNGYGKSYVTSHHGSLARLIMGAEKGELVTFLDGDTLNHRRANLKLLDREAAAEWRRSQIAPVVRH